MLSCFSMQSSVATRALFSAAGAAAARRAMSSAGAALPPLTPATTESATGNGTVSAAGSPAQADPTMAPARPAKAPLSSDFGSLPTEQAPRQQFGNFRRSPTGPSTQRRTRVPYVPVSQGGTNLAADRQLTVQGSNMHHRAGDMYTTSDLDESQPRTFQPAIPTLSTIKFDVFKAMGTDPLQSYKDVTLLSNFVTETGMLMHRKHTKLSAKNQRKLTKAVKRARAMGLMPHTYRMETQTERNRGVGIAEYLNLSPRA